MSAFLELPRRARVWMVVVWMTALFLVAIHLPHVVHWTIQDVFAWVGLSAVAAVLEQFTVKVAHGPEVENYSLTDAVWVPVLIFAPSSVLALSVLTGVTIGQIARRWAWYKVAYNVSFMLECIGHAFKLKKPPMITRYAVWLMGRRCYFSAEKARRELGWKSTMSYKEGVKKTIAWLREQEKLRPA
jgi:hypothetical protein